MRVFLGSLLASLLLVSNAAWAACQGRDLVAALPAADQAALTATAAQQPYAEGILWRAQRGAQVIHLVGTMHFHDPRHQATLDQVIPWLDAATTVMLELGEGDEARLQRKIAETPSLAFITEGPTLPDLLSAEDWDLLRTAMAQRGTPGFFAAKMQPWMALITLGLTKCVVEDVAAGKKGLDGLIMAYAAAIGKPAQALEDYDAALQIFGSYTQDEMLEFLRLFLQLEAFNADDQHHTLVEAYFREEIRAIWAFTVQQALAQPQGMTEAQILAEYDRLEDALMTRRNTAWMARILAAVEAGPVVVAAGALHMPGETGLLALLEEEGFEITRIPRD
jgi:uncharacterized protein YbaP (TraB family)